MKGINHRKQGNNAGTPRPLVGKQRPETGRFNGKHAQLKNMRTTPYIFT